MAGGRSSRQKGDRFERALVNHLQEHGIAAQRVPMSGASAFTTLSGFDLSIPIFSKDYRVECKHYGNGFKMLYDWLAPDFSGKIAKKKNDFLIIRADRSIPLAVIPLPLLIELIKEADKRKK